MASFQRLPEAFENLIRLYLLRILVDLDGHRYLLEDRRISEPWILRFLGVEVDEDSKDYDKGAIVQELRRKLVTITLIAPKPPKNETLTKNIRWLQKTLDLSHVEADITMFLALTHHSHTLSKMCEKAGTLRTHEIHALIAATIGQPFSRPSVCSHPATSAMLSVSLGCGGSRPPQTSSTAFDRRWPPSPKVSAKSWGSHEP